MGGGLRGREGLLRAVEQLTGAVIPASALETLVLPAGTDWAGARFAPSMSTRVQRSSSFGASRQPAATSAQRMPTRTLCE